jgi:Fe-S oxidoreductase
VTDAPRNVLGKVGGLKLSEAEDAGASSLCCGTAAWQNCDYFSEAIRVRRLKEVSEAGAKTLITGCPKCQIHFRCTLSCRPEERGLDPELQVTDMAQLLARAMGLGKGAR